MSWAVVDVFVEVLAFAHELANHLDNLLVIDVVVVGTNDVGVAKLAFVDDEVNGSVMVVDMYPVADLLASTVKFGRNIAQDVGDLARDEFLDVLVRAVIVGAVADGRLDAEATHPGANQMVAAGLGAGVGTGWIVGRVFGEAIGVIELEVTKDFVGADVVQAFAMFANSLEDSVGADDVGFHKGPWVAQGIVVVALGCKVDNDVGVCNQPVHELVVADIASDEVDFVEHRLQVIRIAGVGELVDNSDFILRSVCQGIVHEVRPNKPRTTCN